MKRYALIATVIAAAALAGCQGNTRGQNAGLGAAVGGVGAAAVAAAAGANTTTTLIAAGAGAAAGGIIGAGTTPDTTCVDSNGNRLPPGQYIVNGETINCG